MKPLVSHIQSLLKWRVSVVEYETRHMEITFGDQETA